MSDTKTLVDAVKNLSQQPNVTQPSPWELKELAEANGILTEFGNVNFSTCVRNRSAALTVSLGVPMGREESTAVSGRKQEILQNVPKTCQRVLHYMKKAPLVCVERKMGDNPDFTPLCQLYVSVHRKDCIRIPYLWGSTLFEEIKQHGRIAPHLYILYVPEWQEKDRQMIVLPGQDVTLVLGSDYFGEAKKGFLRMAMWQAKMNGMLGLHAGSKILRARDAKTGKIKRYGMLLFGLSATGKTTHSCHNHGLTEPGEGVEIAQDDVVFWRKDGSALGTERGFFLKTDIDPKRDPLIYKAATSRDALFENVMVDYEGHVDFSDDTLTGNGRGVIQREDLGKENLSPTVNLPALSELDGLILAFITRRNTVLPIASKLSPEQAAAAFMLGESVESSAGDPRRAGESVRVVGTNPFIMGDEAEEGNRFYEFILENRDKIQSYLLNTGGVGEIVEKDANGNKTIKQKVLRVEILEMAAIIRGIARSDIEWIEEPYFGTRVPKRVEGVELSKFDLSKFYSASQIEELTRQIRRERVEYISTFAGLNPAIVKAVRA